MDSTADVKGGVVAYLQVDGATNAAEFYRRAFGAQVVAAHPVDDKGRTMHVHLHINGSSVMLCDSYPEYGHPSEKPQAFNRFVRDLAMHHTESIGVGAPIDEYVRSSTS